jgi:hypothetical protein
MSTSRILKLDPSLSLCTSINSKWIKDVNVRSEKVKLIQEKVSNTLDHINIFSDSMNGTPIALQLRESFNKWDYMKLKKLLHNKRSSHQSEQNGRKSLPAILLTRN